MEEHPRHVRRTAANSYSSPAYLDSRSARLALRSMGARLERPVISSARAVASATACCCDSDRPAAQAAAKASPVSAAATSATNCSWRRCRAGVRTAPSVRSRLSAVPRSRAATSGRPWPTDSLASPVRQPASPRRFPASRWRGSASQKNAAARVPRPAPASSILNCRARPRRRPISEVSTERQTLVTQGEGAVEIAPSPCHRGRGVERPGAGHLVPEAFP